MKYCIQAKFMCEHHYIKNSQAIYLEHCKSIQQEDNAQFHNPRCHSRLSLEQQPSNTPSLCYLQNQESLTHESVCVILDHMKHDLNTVNTFL